MELRSTQCWTDQSYCCQTSGASRKLATGEGGQPHTAGSGRTVGAAAGPGQVLLVVGFGEVEGFAGEQLGGDRREAGGAELLLVVLAAGGGQLGLGLGGGHDRRAVLAAGVVALGHALGGVVAFPEQLEQVSEAHPGGVPHHPHRLGVAGAAGADLLVGGVGGVAAAVAHGGGDHPGQPPEALLRPPETAAAEEGLLLAGLQRRLEGGAEHHMGAGRGDRGVAPRQGLLGRHDPALGPAGSLD